MKIALRQARPARPDTAAIVRAMLNAGANAEVARAFMEAGLDPRLGEIALEAAVENGESEIAHVLEEHGAREKP